MSVLASIPTPPSIAIADRVREMEASGDRVLKMQTGDPPFPTPAPIIAAMLAAVERGETHYVHSRGLLELREAIARRHEEDRGQSVDPDRQLLVTAGGEHALFVALAATITPGTPVALLEPYYPQYEYLVRWLGGVPRPIPPHADESTGRLVPDLGVARSVISESEVLVVNSPCNPSGCVLSDTELGQIAALANASDTAVISDEVYDHTLSNQRRHSSMAGRADRLLLVGSFSKTYAMTGWRLGFLHAGGALIDQAGVAAQLSTTCVPAFVQHGGIAALTDSSVSKEVDAMAQHYSANRELATRILRDAGARLVEPEGAFYALLRVPEGFGGNGAEWAEHVLEEQRVAVTPGGAYGPNMGDYVRLSLAGASDEVAEGLGRIATVLA